MWIYEVISDFTTDVRAVWELHKPCYQEFLHSGHWEHLSGGSQEGPDWGWEELPTPPPAQTGFRTDSGIGEGSVCSDVKDNHPDDLDDPKDGEILFFSFFNVHIFLITAVKHNFIW